MKPKHCWHCKYFEESVFETETENGMGSWYGYCRNAQKSGRVETRGRFLSCDYGELSEEQLRKDEPFTCRCGKNIPRIKRWVRGNDEVCGSECAGKIDAELIKNKAESA
jgi:hypothetical protein